MSEEKTIKKLSLVGIGGNIVLSAFKLFAGAIGKSNAMVSDGVHSLSDVVATFIAIIGVKMAGKDPDNDHPYGHERFESIASMILGVILAFAGVGIGYAGISKIISGEWKNLEIPTFLPLIAAVVSIVVKEAMFHYTMHHAKRLNSDAFVADAWHHRSDAFSSIGSFIGIGAAKLGYPVMDVIASTIICLFILKTAYDIVNDAIKKVLDTSCSPEFEKKIREFIENDEDVEGIDLLMTRQFGNKVYVDCEIAVDRYSTLLDAHNVAERVHDNLEKEFPEIKHIMIHVNPGEDRG